MYALYYYPGNASLTPHMILEHIGAPFELRLVDRANNAHKSPEYLKLNPRGLIPVLIDDDTALFETAAISLHLADKHPEAGLAPACGSSDRAVLYQWLMAMTNGLQAEYISYFYPERYIDDSSGVEDVKAQAEVRLETLWDVFEEQLANGPFLLGETFSLLDYYLLMLARWGRGMKRPPRTLKNTGAFLERVSERPAVQRTFASEGLSSPFY